MAKGLATGSRTRDFCRGFQQSIAALSLGEPCGGSVNRGAVVARTWNQEVRRDDRGTAANKKKAMRVGHRRKKCTQRKGRAPAATETGSYPGPDFLCGGLFEGGHLAVRTQGFRPALLAACANSADRLWSCAWWGKAQRNFNRCLTRCCC